jgi:DNA-binding CsgD family transcriptional regulator
LSSLLRGNTCDHLPVKARSRRKVAEAREEAALALRVKGYTEARIARELGITQQSVHEALQRAMGKRKLLTDEEIIFRKHEQTMILEHKLEEAVDAWEKSKRDAETERIVEKSLAKSNVKDEEEPQAHGGSLKRSRRVPLEAGSRADAKDRSFGDDMDPANWDMVDLESVPGYFYNEKTGEETLPEERAGILATWLMEQMKAGRDPEALQSILERTVTTTTTGQCGDPRYLELIRKLLADIRTIWGLDAPQKAEVITRDGDITDEERAARIAAILDRGRTRRDQSAS